MSEHKSQAQLAAQLTAANQQVAVGACYMHYRQQSYKVIALALLEANLEPCVVYQAEYGEHITFIRPLSDWLAEIEVNGQMIKRFTQI